MQPQPTPVSAPMQLRIADDLRLQIEAGDLEPGDPLPTLGDLASDYDVSVTTARNAIVLLKQQGLITGGRGKAPVVRPKPRRVRRDSSRHQHEKNMVRKPVEQRETDGLAEIDLGTNLDDLDFNASYDNIEAGDLATVFGIEKSDLVVRRHYEHSNHKTGHLEAWSVSYLPLHLISGNPAIADEANAAWPGGTMHQLYTVGIEVAKVVDEVSASMPSTVDKEKWGIADGVPLLWVRRISIDTTGQVVEVSDAQYPADRTTLSFDTQLELWEDES